MGTRKKTHVAVSKAPPLLGLIALYGPASTGKTRALAALGREWGLTPHRYCEPLEPINLTWPELIPSADPVGESEEDEIGLEEGRGEFSPAAETIYLVDSLREILFSSGGTTLKGGLSSGALLKMTSLHNSLVEMGSGMLAVINPIYPEEGMSREAWALAQELISGSIGGLITAKGAGATSALEFESVGSRFFDPEPFSSAEPTSLRRWEVVRDRFSQLDPLLTLLNNLEVK